MMYVSLAQRLRRWSYIHQALDQRYVFAGRQHVKVADQLPIYGVNLVTEMVPPPATGSAMPHTSFHLKPGT